MTIPLESRRIVIAGASSLFGAELKALLEESRFAACDFRLVDEEIVAGTLTEAGGEAAVIQPVEDDSFHKAWAVFFTGSPAFTKRNLRLAQRSGAVIVDLSGELAGTSGARSWLPKFETAASQNSRKDDVLYVAPSAPAEIIARLAMALHSANSNALTAVAFHPVSSSAGKAGIEELESQTGQLLSFQPLGKQVFDAQIAFTMVDRFGSQSRHNLQVSLQTLRREVRSCLPKEIHAPAVRLLHAPVYYGTTVTGCAFLDAAVSATEITRLCTASGFSITDGDSAPTNISPAGETALQLASPQPDSTHAGAWWFWAAADNIRLPASNAVKLAEKLLE